MDHGRDFFVLSFRDGPAFPQLLSLTGSWHGRVREEAVRRLGALRDIEALPALIERLNDWVPQVRDAAREAIDPLLVEANALAFVRSLPQLQLLLARVRDNHGVFVARVEAFLVAVPQSTHVLEAVRGSDRRLAGLCLRLAMKYALVDDTERVELGLAHGDIAIALEAVAQISTMPAAQRRAFAERALDHALAPVRRDAFRLLLADGIAQERIEAFAFDRHAAVRALATRHLRNAGVDIAALYRAELASPHSRRQRCAIEGIARHGTVDDVRALRPLLAAPSAAIRRCALVAWTMKHRLDAIDDVVAALSDPAPSVACQAAVLAEIVYPQFDADAMLALSMNPVWTVDDGPLLGAFAYSNKWEMLIFTLLRLVQAHCPPERAEWLLRYWQMRAGRSSIQPRPAQIARVQQLIDQSDRELISTLRRMQLDFFLSSIGVEFA